MIDKYEEIRNKHNKSRNTEEKTSLNENIE